jgi:hypothetical protein
MMPELKHLFDAEGRLAMGIALPLAASAGGAEPGFYALPQAPSTGIRQHEPRPAIDIELAHRHAQTGHPLALLRLRRRCIASRTRLGEAPAQ